MLIKQYVFKAAILAVFSVSALGQNEEPKVKMVPGKIVSMDPSHDDGKINCDFPEPTDLRDIAKAFSLWTGTNYAVDDSVKTKVRLISDERITKAEALKRFHRMLASYKLKAVEDGSGYRIVNESSN